MVLDQNSIIALVWTIVFFIFQILGCLLYHNRKTFYPFQRLSPFVQYLGYVPTSLWFLFHTGVPLLRQDYPCVWVILLQNIAVPLFCAQAMLKGATLLFLYKTTLASANLQQHKPPIHTNYVRLQIWMTFPYILVPLCMLMSTGVLLVVLLLLLESKTHESTMCYEYHLSDRGKIIYNYGQKVSIGLALLIGSIITYELRGCKESLSQKQELFWTILGGSVGGFLAFIYFPMTTRNDQYNAFPIDWTGMAYLSFCLVINTYWPLYRSWEFQKWNQAQNTLVRPVDTLRGCLMDDGEQYTKFLQFCMSEFAMENVFFWKRVETYIRMNFNHVPASFTTTFVQMESRTVVFSTFEPNEKDWCLLSFLLRPIQRDLIKEILNEARRIYTGFIHSSSELQVNLPSDLQRRLDGWFRDQFTEERFCSLQGQGENEWTLWTLTLIHCFDDAQKEIYQLMERDSWSRYQRRQI